MTSTIRVGMEVCLVLLFTAAKYFITKNNKQQYNARYFDIYIYVPLMDRRRVRRTFNHLLVQNN